MSKAMKRSFSLILALIMMLSVPVQALAEQQSGLTDMPNDWSRDALTRAVANGLIKGYEDNTIRPNGDITRAEVATVINRAFGATKTAKIDFLDVMPNQWFHSEVSKAVGMGSFDNNGSFFRPDVAATREEVFLALSNGLHLKADKADKVFIDSSEISDFARAGVYGLINEGYIAGSDGRVNPKMNITRAEFAQIMHNIIKDYVKVAGTYGKVNSGNVIVNSPNTTLKNLIIDGDLIIAEGVGEGEVILDNVVVKGRMLVRAGGENSIIIKGNSDIKTIIIVKDGNKVRIYNESGKEIETIEVEGDADVELEGNFKDVIIQSSNITVFASNGKIETVDINGDNSRFVSRDKSQVETIRQRGENGIIEGDGKVKKVVIESTGSGTAVVTPNTEIYVERGATGVTGTNRVRIPTRETYVNGRDNNKDSKPSTRPGTGGNNDWPDRELDYRVDYSVINNRGTIIATGDYGRFIRTGSLVEDRTWITFTAEPETGYEVKEWTLNGRVLAEKGDSLDIRVDRRTVVTVEFKLKDVVIPPIKYTVTHSVIGGNGTLTGTVASGDEVEAGTSVVLTATPNIGYKIKEWKVDGTVVSNIGNSLTREVNSNTIISVEFKEIPVSPTRNVLTYSVVSGNGTIKAEYAETDEPVASGTSINIDTHIRFTATPNDGYRVKQWLFNDSKQAQTGNQFIVGTDFSEFDVKVEFEKIPVEPIMYTLTYSVFGGAGTGGVVYSPICYRQVILEKFWQIFFPN